MGKYCKFCGVALSSDAKFCKACGKALYKQPDTANSKAAAPDTAVPTEIIDKTITHEIKVNTPEADISEAVAQADFIPKVEVQADADAAVVPDVAANVNIKEDDIGRSNVSTSSAVPSAVVRVAAAPIKGFKQGNNIKKKITRPVRLRIIAAAMLIIIAVTAGIKLLPGACPYSGSNAIKESSLKAPQPRFL
ncbi:MAG: hypothetical protein AB9835_06630 [Eubacteriales bacterium]